MIMTSMTTLPHAAMLQETATILWNHRVDTHYCRMGLSCRTHYKDSRPGQFVTLRLPDETSPLLRRPFSIHRLIRQDGAVSGIEILYKIVGTFTEKLSRTPVSAAVDLLLRESALGERISEKIVIPTELVVRHSTAPPGVRSRNRSDLIKEAR